MDRERQPLANGDTFDGSEGSIGIAIRSSCHSGTRASLPQECPVIGHRALPPLCGGGGGGRAGGGVEIVPEIGVCRAISGEVLDRAFCSA